MIFNGKKKKLASEFLPLNPVDDDCMNMYNTLMIFIIQMRVGDIIDHMKSKRYSFTEDISVSTSQDRKMFKKIKS